jgi:hypothetical protein
VQFTAQGGVTTRSVTAKLRHSIVGEKHPKTPLRTDHFLFKNRFCSESLEQGSRRSFIQLWRSQFSATWQLNYDQDVISSL